MSRRPHGYNVYRSGDSRAVGSKGPYEFVGYHPNLLPVVPTTPGTLRVLDVNRETAQMDYQDVRALVGQGVAYLSPRLSTAAERRARTCTEYIRQYVLLNVMRDIEGQDLSSPSTKFCAQHTARQALDFIAETHPDPLLRYLAAWGEWGLLLNGTVEITSAGLAADAPAHEGF